MREGSTAQGITLSGQGSGVVLGSSRPSRSHSRATCRGSAQPRSRDIPLLEKAHSLTCFKGKREQPKKMEKKPNQNRKRRQRE